MLELNEKRTVYRMIEGRVVKIKQSPLDVMNQPVGVHTNSLVECNMEVTRALYNRVIDLEDLLRRLCQTAAEANAKADALSTQGGTSGTENG